MTKKEDLIQSLEEEIVGTIKNEERENEKKMCIIDGKTVEVTLKRLLTTAWTVSLCDVETKAVVTSGMSSYDEAKDLYDSFSEIEDEIEKKSGDEHD